MRRSLLLPLSISFVLAACSGDRQVVPPKVTFTLAVTPANPMVVKGMELRFEATATYSDGREEDVTIDADWSSEDQSIASVIGRGHYDTFEEGTVAITAEFESQTATTSITVLPTPIRTIDISPASASIEELDTQRFTATATLRDGTELDVTNTLPWETSNAAVATVEVGLAIGVSAGRAVISVTDPGTGARGAATLNVNEPTIDRLTLVPNTTMLADGTTQQLQAIAELSNGSSEDLTAEVDWTSSDPAVATVGDDAMDKGLVTALAEGMVTIEARHRRSNERATTRITVTPAQIRSIRINPNTGEVPVGGNLFFRAVATFTDEREEDVTNTVEWRAQPSGVVTVSNNPLERGTVVAVGVGTATVSAYDPGTGTDSTATNESAVITVTPAELTRIAVLPATAQVASGLTQQFQAIATYSDDSTRDVTTSVTWLSSNTMAATVDANGLADTHDAGLVTISATDPTTNISSSATNQSATLTVDPPGLLSIGISPATSTVVEGLSINLVATGQFTDGTPRDISSGVLWSRTNPIVSINNGTVTGNAPGTTVVSARDQATGISSTTSGQDATVFVEPLALVSIAVAPGGVALPVGATAPLTATGTYNDMTTVDMTQTVQWMSSNTGVATVGTVGNTTGLARAVGTGAAIISVTDPMTGIMSTGTGGSASINVLPNVTLSSLSFSDTSLMINIGQTEQLTVMGTFSNGQQYDMTDSVNYTSLQPGFATVSNVDGSRGEVTGVGVGTANISATHPGTNLSTTSNAAVQVRVGQIAQTWPGPTRTVDSTGTNVVNVGTVSFAAADFGTSAQVTGVVVAVNFLKTDGSCSLPRTGYAYHNETHFRLVSPQGTSVVLAQPNTWSGGTAISAVTVTFDQTAASTPSGTPVTGTFRPNGGNLTTFNTQNPVGNWTLQAGDTAGGDPLCVNNFTLTVTAQ